MPEYLSLCFPGNSASPGKLYRETSDMGKQSLLDSAIQFIMPRCLWPEEQKLKLQIGRVDIQDQHQNQHQEKLHEKVRQLTLEEWFLISSPRIGMDRSLSGEHNANCRQHRSSVHPSTSGEDADNCDKSRERPSFERFLKGNDVSVEDMSFQCQCSQSMERNQVPKSKKRVSFKLPDEDDIVVFHSSPCELES